MSEVDAISTVDRGQDNARAYKTAKTHVVASHHGHNSDPCTDGDSHKDERENDRKTPSGRIGGSPDGESQESSGGLIDVTV